MLRLLSRLSLLPVLLTPAIGQTSPPADSGRANLVAEKLTRNGAQVHAVGHAQATIGALAFHADEATFRSDTGELELRGHVRVALPARADKNLFRYDIGALVTDQPVDLSADRMTVKGGLLQASGNITVRPAGAQLQGDELSMTLSNADGTLTGHVRATGDLRVTDPPKRRRFPDMPPDIVK